MLTGLVFASTAGDACPIYQYIFGYNVFQIADVVHTGCLLVRLLPNLTLITCQLSTNQLDKEIQEHYSF